SQSNAPAAHGILLASARGTAHPELQAKAITFLGIAGGEDNLKVLDEVYRGASRPEVKQSVLNAYLISGQRRRALAAARDAKAPLQDHAIGQLGAMHAVEELKQLYAAGGAPDTRQKILNALGVAGAVDTLIDIARREPNSDLRGTAIRGLG